MANSNWFTRPFKKVADGISSRATAALIKGKAGAAELLGIESFRGSGSNFRRLGRNLKHSFNGFYGDPNRARNNAALGREYLERAAGIGGEMMGTARNWATGAGATGWRRAGQVGARMGPIAGAAGLGAWGLNRNSR